jgi:hypothetical protein
MSLFTVSLSTLNRGKKLLERTHNEFMSPCNLTELEVITTNATTIKRSTLLNTTQEELLYTERVLGFGIDFLTERFMKMEQKKEYPG